LSDHDRDGLRASQGNLVWRKRGELLKSLLKANGVFCFEIGRITGTAEAAE
jgi:hypothetical protein